MKANSMKGIPAIVLSEENLKSMLVAAGELAATLTVEKLERQIIQSPDEKTILQLRGFIQDRGSVTNPREHWANGTHIKSINPASTGKPRTNTWFHHFKTRTGLRECFCRQSPQHARMKEWTFEDIANAWDIYYGQCFPTLNWDK